MSTDEQADSRAGIDAQRAAIAAEATRRGWTVVDVVEDAGYSGKDTRRPGLASALDAMRLGEADVLVVSKLDRLSRSVLDFSSISQSAAKEGWACIALDADVDPTTPMGEAMVTIMATFAQLERRLIGQRTRDALAIRKQQGVKLGRPSGLSPIVVERILQERAEGRTLTAIADDLTAEGTPTSRGKSTWYPSAIKDIVERAAAA